MTGVDSTSIELAKMLVGQRFRHVVSSEPRRPLSEEPCKVGIDVRENVVLPWLADCEAIRFEVERFVQINGAQINEGYAKCGVGAHTNDVRVAHIVRVLVFGSHAVRNVNAAPHGDAVD